MGFRFFKRFNIFPGISVNLSKTGISFSLHTPGIRLTIGKYGIRKTIGIPGTGVYYTKYDSFTNVLDKVVKHKKDGIAK